MSDMALLSDEDIMGGASRVSARGGGGTPLLSDDDVMGRDGKGAPPTRTAPTRSWSDVPGEALRNAQKSAGEFVHALVQPILHPIDTANAVGDIAQGAASSARGKETTSREDADRAAARLAEFDSLTEGMDPDKPVLLKGFGRVVPSVARERLARTAANAGEFAATAPEGEAAEVAGRNASRAEAEKKWGAVADFFVHRYGTEEGFKEAVATDPVGVMADFATVLTGGGGALARAPGMVGRAGQIASTFGSAIDPVMATARTVGAGARLGAQYVAEPLAAHGLGFTTGAGAESVRMAGRAGREGGELAEVFAENMRGAPVRDVVDRAQEALQEIRRERSRAYLAGMADLSEDSSIMNFDRIDRAVDRAAEVGTFRGRSGAGHPVTTEPMAVDVVNRMREEIGGYRVLDPADYHTPVGIDALKRALGNIRDATQPHTPERVAADRIYNAVRNEIIEQAPIYGRTMEEYARASDDINEVTRTFSLREQATGDTAARKLLSATRNNVQTNYGERQRLLDLLAERDPTLPAAIAGQALNALPPRGLVARAGGGMTAATNPWFTPAFSPRIVGETVFLGGRAIGRIDDVAEAFGITADHVRAATQGAFQAGRAKQNSETKTDVDKIMSAQTIDDAIRLAGGGR